MAKRSVEEEGGGLPAWMGTYGDMVTLLLCFFVLLFSMSSVDVRKFKEAIASFNNQIDIMPGGVALTDGERINNGVSQLDNIEILIEKSLPTSLEDDKNKGEGEDQDKEALSEAEILDAALEQAEKVYEKVDSYLQEKDIREDLEVSYSLNYVKITLPGELLFDSGKAKIKSKAFSIIDVIGEMAKQEDYQSYKIQIEGHTDNVPMKSIYFPSNWELSASRAIAVGKYLIDTFGFQPDRIGVTGYGEYKPIVPNDSDENRSKNRRVEIKIILQTKEIQEEEYNALNEPKEISGESQ